LCAAVHARIEEHNTAVVSDQEAGYLDGHLFARRFARKEQGPIELKAATAHRLGIVSKLLLQVQCDPLVLRDG
jgi:hypothetical protein